MLACSGEGGPYFRDDSGDPSVGGPCADESERACGLTLEMTSESMTCYRGVQVCEGGVWSPCRDGSVTREPLPGFGFDPTKRRVYANSSLSDPAACGDGQGTGGSGAGGGPSTADFANPCDPGCMHFEENPTDLTANGGSSSGPPLEFPPRMCGANTLCIAQGTIDPTCDPCATKIAAKYPNCATAWTQECVFRATTECVGVTPPTNACDFGLLADGNLVLSNQGSANSSIGAYGNVEVKADSRFGSIYALGNVDIRNLNNAHIAMASGGGIFSNGYIKFDASDLSVITGNLHAKTYVDLNNVDVVGDVWAGTNILTAGNGAKVNGHAYATGTIPESTNKMPPGPLNIPVANRHPGHVFTPVVVNLPPKNGPAPGTVVPILDTSLCPAMSAMTLSGNQVLTPGVYGAVDATTLELNGQGTYYFYSLKVGSTLRLDLKNQPYTTGFDVRVCNAGQYDASQTTMFGNGMKVVGKNGLANDSNGVLKDPKYLTLFYRGTVKVKMETNVYWTGVFMAPYAAVEKAPVHSPPTQAQILAPLATRRSAPVNGAIWAKELSLEPGALTSAINSADCNAIDHLPIVSPPECPLDSGTRGLKNEPCESGQDCQANSRCFRPKTGMSCGSSKCVTSPTPLAANCDPCVARICKTMPNCCTGSWNADCVTAVSTVCDAVCQAGDCTQNPCVSSAQPIAKACQDNLGADCVRKTCDAMPSCCTTAWTNACVTKMMEPGICGSISTQKRLCDLAAYGKNSYASNGATVTGLTGTAATLDPDPRFDMHNGYFSCQGGASHGPAAGNFTPAQGHYGSVHMGYGTTLRFPTSGYYYMNELTLDGGNTIEFPNGGFVDLVVCGGKVTIGPDTKYTGLQTTGGAPTRFRVYSNYVGAGAIWIHPSTIAASAPENTSYGLLVASNGEVRIGANIRHHGMIWARDVTLSASATITYSATSEAECKREPLQYLDNGPVPGGATCAVSLIPVPASETAKCVDNATNYKDPTCATFDLALGTPCMTGTTLGIPICNHGVGNFTGLVTVGRYAENLGQMAIDEPTVAPTGSHGQMMTIAAGRCTQLDWPMFPNGRYTLFLDPAKVLSECNNRRLDNWSATDGRECIPFSQPRTVEYEYEAECPDESRALWGSLTWNTATPGDSRIVFSLKAGDNDAELDAATYVEAGIARRTPEDTQVCVFKDATPCYADVTETLDLGRNQPQMLRLKADLLPGNGSPVLRDWGISYSCVYDE